MGQLVIDDIIWKKGESGIQTFNIKDSDGDARNITGKTYTFHFWLPATSPEDKGSGALSLVTPGSGIATYTLAATDTDTAGIYDAEIIENPGTDDLKSKTFKVIILESGP